MTPLWKILGWRQSEVGWVYPPDSGVGVPPVDVDELVTETHLLDWLDANTAVHGGTRYRISRNWAHYAEVPGVAHEFQDFHPDRRTAIESVVRQVHAAIGGDE